jgi:hypothetical protein
MELLKFEVAIQFPGFKRFDAADHFQTDSSKETAVRISHLNHQFRTFFLTKVEDNIEPVELRIYKIVVREKRQSGWPDPYDKSFMPASIISDLKKEAALGPGYDRIHDTQLAHLWFLLSRQARGQSGSLLTNGKTNLSYISDREGTLWDVHANWDSQSDGWKISAGQIMGDYGKSYGEQFVARKV